MIRDENFWKTELEAPLLRRNAGYVHKSTVEEVVKRAELWIDLTEPYHLNQKHEIIRRCPDPEIQRVFEIDAERTFALPSHRTTHIETLATIYNVIKDYHQGLGFIVAFLLLFLEPEDVMRIVVALNDHYVPGYFQAFSFNYFRDAKVFEKLLEKYNPSMYKHLNNLLSPETFCSKWFVGFNIHVLTFPAIADYFDQFLADKSSNFQFKFGLSLIDHVQEKILPTNDVSKILAYLRLDSMHFPEVVRVHTAQETSSDFDKDFFCELVDAATEIDLTKFDISTLREEASLQLHQAVTASQKHDKEDSSDEIVFSEEET